MPKHYYCGVCKRRNYYIKKLGRQQLPRVIDACRRKIDTKTFRQTDRNTDTQTDKNMDRWTDKHRQTDRQTHRQTDRHTGNTSTVAMVFGIVQVRSSASPSPRPRWLLVTCSRHSPIPLGLPPSPPPCRSPRSSRWVVCKIEKYIIFVIETPFSYPHRVNHCREVAGLSENKENI